MTVTKTIKTASKLSDRQHTLPGNLTVIRIKKVVFIVYFISLLTIRAGDVRLGCPVNQCKFQALILCAER